MNTSDGLILNCMMCHLHAIPSRLNRETLEADIGSLAADIISILIRAEKPGKALTLRLNDKVGSGYRRLVRAARRASSQDARGDTPGEP